MIKKSLNNISHAIIALIAICSTMIVSVRAQSNLADHLGGGATESYIIQTQNVSVNLPFVGNVTLAIPLPTLTVTAPTYTLNGQVFTNVGDAFSFINSGSAIRYFHVNSIGADSVASGLDAMSIGSLATGVGEQSIAFGYRAEANDYRVIAIGSKAGNQAMANSRSIYIGEAAGMVSSGSNNFAAGRESMYGAAGSYNIALGDEANKNAANAHYTTAIGTGAQASGTSSIAIGTNASATYDAAVAIGLNAKATQGSAMVGARAGENSTGTYNTGLGRAAFLDGKGDGNTALGFATLYKAVGGHNTAVGYEAMGYGASGDYNIAIGAHAMRSDPDAGAKASGTQNIVLGTWAFRTGAGNENYIIGSYAMENATGNNNIAFGYQANKGLTNLNKTIALGYQTIASGEQSMAFGANAQASGIYSFAIGTTATASGTQSIALGFRASASDYRVTAIGARAGDNAYNNAESTYIGWAAGGRSTGTSNVAIGSASLMEAIGNDNVAIGNMANYKVGAAEKTVAIGDHVTASGAHTVALSTSATATSDGAQAIGYHASATAEVAQAFGSNATASGRSAQAFGAMTTASGMGAQAFGYAVTASGDASQAFGVYTRATALSSMAFGTSATATGISAEAIGTGAYASGSSAIAIGTNASAIYDAAVAIGLNAKATQGSAMVGARAGENSTGDYNTGLGRAAFLDAEGEANTALGYATLYKAKGKWNTATGFETLAYGAEGDYNVAIGAHSMTSEVDTNTLDIITQAKGTGNSALGFESFFAGQGDYNLVMGYAAMRKATGSYNIALGYEANKGVNADYATAIGYQASASALNSIALGRNANAGAENSIALGAGSVVLANQGNVVSVGAAGSERKIINVADGIIAAASTDAINGGQLYTVNQQVLLNSDNIAGLRTDVNTLRTDVGTVDTIARNSERAIIDLQTNLGTSIGDIGLLRHDVGVLRDDVTYLDAIGVKYTDATRNAIVLGNGTTPVSMTNLADGINPTDAVNMGQLTPVITDVTGLRHDVNIMSGDVSALRTDVNTVNAIARANETAIINLQTNLGASIGDIGLLRHDVGVLRDDVNHLDNIGVKYTDYTKQAVSFGNTGTAVKLTNVAEGDVSANSTDAVTGAQLFAVTGSVNALNDRAVVYDGAEGSAKTTITLAENGGAGTLLTNLASGTLSATSMNAVNGSQLYAANNALAAALGTTLDATGLLVAPVYTVSGSGYNNVGSAISALDTQAVKFDATGNANLQGKKITNLAEGVISGTSTDAVTGAQLYAISGSLSTLTSNAVKFDAAGGDANLNNKKIVNLMAGALSAASTEAVNGSQLFATNLRVTALETAVTAINAQPHTPHFTTGADDLGNVALASGGNAVAAGAGAVASGTNSATYGAKSKAAAANSVAIGNTATVEAGASGGMALGANAVVMAGATNSIALGAGSVASQPNTVSIGSAGHERRLVNVADGLNDFDAVNVRQLNMMAEDTYARIDSMTRSMDTLNKRIDSVGALSAAIAQVQPRLLGTKNQNQLSVGGGVYRNAAAAALGYSYTNKIGNRAAGASVAVSDEGEVTGGAGITFGW